MIVFPVFHFPLPQSSLPFLRSILSFLRPSLTECMLFSIISFCHKTKQWQALPSIVYHVAWASLPCSRVNLVPVVSLPLIVSPISPAAREKDLLPPPSLEHQNPPRPRSKPPGGKTAPRKEPRSATNSNTNTATPPAVLQQTPLPVPAVSVNQVSFRCVCVCTAGRLQTFGIGLNTKYRCIRLYPILIALCNSTANVLTRGSFPKRFLFVIQSQLCVNIYEYIQLLYAH